MLRDRAAAAVGVSTDGGNRGKPLGHPPLFTGRRETATGNSRDGREGITAPVRATARCSVRSMFDRQGKVSSDDGTAG